MNVIGPAGLAMMGKNSRVPKLSISSKSRTLFRVLLGCLHAHGVLVRKIKNKRLR